VIVPDKELKQDLSREAVAPITPIRIFSMGFFSCALNFLFQFQNEAIPKPTL